MTETNQTREQLNNKEWADHVLGRIMLGRAAKPREIADLMVFLASERSAYTSGVIFTVDGGLVARGG